MRYIHSRYEFYHDIHIVQEFLASFVDSLVLISQGLLQWLQYLQTVLCKSGKETVAVNRGFIVLEHFSQLPISRRITYKSRNNTIHMLKLDTQYIRIFTVQIFSLDSNESSSLAVLKKLMTFSTIFCLLLNSGVGFIVIADWSYDI